MKQSLHEPPSKCNIFGVSYRTVTMMIAIILMAQNICYIITYALRQQLLSCYLWSHGLYSLIIQYGDEYWSLAGLLIALLSLATNTSLLFGAIWNAKRLILLWYVGGTIQFLYLISLQSFCLYTKSCNNHCQMDPEAKQQYKMGFGWCLFLTIYFYTTFIFKIQLFYIYVGYKNRPRRSENVIGTYNFGRPSVI